MKKLSRPIDKGQERGILLSYHLPDFWLPDEDEKDEKSSQHVKHSDNAQKYLKMKTKYFQIIFLSNLKFQVHLSGLSILP